MPSPSRLQRPPRRLGFAPILLANLLPLVGIRELGWDPATLVVVYALEFLFSFLLAAAKALFAQRPPRADRDEGTLISVSSDLTEKRGSVRPVPWLPPIYPRNVPFATAVVLPAVWFLIIVGAVLSDVVALSEVVTRPDVLVSVAALIAGQSVEVWRDVRRGSHETASPFSVVETPGRQAFFVTFVLFSAPTLSALGTDVVLGVLIGVKLLVEWSAYRATHGGSGRLTGWLSGPEPAADDRDPVPVPDGDPDARVPTDGRAVLYTGVCRVLGKYAPPLAGPFLILWLLALSLLGDDAPPSLAIGSLLGVFALYVGFLAAEVGTFYLRYGPLEYRRYGDRLVAYDALVDEPQWSASIAGLRHPQVVPDRLADRLLGTRTVAVTTGWSGDEQRRKIGPVADPDALVAGLELPIETTEPEPLDRHLAAVVVACLVGVVVAVVVLAAGPWISPTRLLFTGLAYGTFAIPFGGLALRLLWMQAYPERSE